MFPPLHFSDIAPFLKKESLFPLKRHPFYIVAPPYIRTSAGIKALHLLCHHLNAIGQPAWIATYPILYHDSPVNPDWNTPVLTPKLAAHHFEQGLAPVAIYPETVAGNPLNVPVVMRYVMNYPGLLGGDAIYDPSEIVYGYSKRLAAAAGAPEKILFMPVSDSNIFYPPADSRAPRKGSCFWAAKYKHYHNGTLFPVTADSVEITRDLPDSQTPQEMADLFRRSEIFYSYENTALAIEAMLCGCPTVFLPNPYFTECIGLDEFAMCGFAWGDSPEEVARARATVAEGRERYRMLVDTYWHDLLNMVNSCHARAEATPYNTPAVVRLRNASDQVRQLAKNSLCYWRSQGNVATIKKIASILKRDGLSTLFTRGWEVGRFALGRVVRRR